jgi:anti-sigma regulatory factor (Ser/Thr protein kinase)
MDTLLIDAWMAGTDPLPTIDDASVSVARELCRARGAELGLDRTVIESAAVAASELVRNHLVHGRRGQFAVLAVERSGVPGLELVAADLGLGIADPERALAGPGPSPRSLGAGLSGARRMTHEMDVDVRWGEGTCVRARIFAEPVPRRREVGILGRAFEEEPMSGDHAAFVRTSGALVVTVVDGIGHGPLARDAADRAVEAWRERAGLSPAAILDACEDELAGTRGVVMAVARLDEDLAAIEHAAVGNVTTRLDGHRRSRSLAGSASTLGARGARKRVAVESGALDDGEVLLMFTDGLTSRAGLSDEADLFREHPIVIAQRLLADFGRTTDDALVLVAR